MFLTIADMKKLSNFQMYELIAKHLSEHYTLVLLVKKTLKVKYLIRTSF